MHRRYFKTALRTESLCLILNPVGTLILEIFCIVPRLKFSPFVTSGTIDGFKAAYRRLVFLLFGLLMGLMIAGCGPEKSAENPSESRSASTAKVSKPHVDGVIVAVGDSLTFGLGVEDSAYPELLEKQLRARGYAYRVVNAGISGETSSGTLSRIDWVIRSLKPDMIILTIGANDGLRGIDPGVLRDNLDQLVSKIKAGNIDVLLCGMKMLPNLGSSYIKAFEKVYPDIAEKKGVLLMPFFLVDVAGDPRLNQTDGIHPNAAGYARIVENLFPYVEKLIQQHRSQKAGS